MGAMMREPTTQEIVDKAAWQIRKDILWFFACQAILTVSMFLVLLART